MKVRNVVILAGGLISSGVAAVAANATTQIVSTANAFLATLDEKQRQSVLFAFDDEQQRAR